MGIGATHAGRGQKAFLLLFSESLERRAVGFEREGIAPLLVWGHDYDDIAVIQWGLGHHMQAAGGRHS